jgi:hypothetical protein
VQLVLWVWPVGVVFAPGANSKKLELMPLNMHQAILQEKSICTFLAVSECVRV